MQKMIEKETENAILTAQRIEITAHYIYHKLSQSAIDPRNKSVLKQISDDELKHYNRSFDPDGTQGLFFVKNKAGLFCLAAAGFNRHLIRSIT